jgi:hypothetical protein
LSSHYKFHTVKEEGYYTFESDNHITYKCFFTQKFDNGNSLLGLRLNSPVMFFSFNRENRNDPVIYDRRIGFTISEILNQFFELNPNAIIAYICDDADLKAIKRQNHFEKWFSSHNKRPKKTLIKAEIHNMIYVGTILLADHPEKSIITSYFSEELRKFKESDKSGEINVLE